MCHGRIFPFVSKIGYLLLDRGYCVIPGTVYVILRKIGVVLGLDPLRQDPSSLECRYIKGRDIFDLWYLRTVLKVTADKEMIERKFRMYVWPFQAARNLGSFTDPSSVAREEQKTAIREDLVRFLPLELIVVHQVEGYASFLPRFSHCFWNYGRRRRPCRDSGENSQAVAATFPLRRCGEIHQQRQCISDADTAKRAGRAHRQGVYVNAFLKFPHISG